MPSFYHASKNRCHYKAKVILEMDKLGFRACSVML